MIEYPLTKANRIRLARAFRDVPRVDLSIECALESQMGRAYVDDIDHPVAFKIQVGPFFYLAGDPASTAAQAMLGEIGVYMLFMPSAPGWLEAAQAMYADRLMPIDRYSFSSGQLSPDRLEQLCLVSAYASRVEQMDLEFAQSLWGREHFIDLSDYDSPGDFIERGTGFYVRDGGSVAGAAFASLACSRGIEVSLYVDEPYRRKGMATVLSANLLRWCMQHSTDPHWDAANPESCALAIKLGYKPQGSYLAHYLRE